MNHWQNPPEQLTLPKEEIHVWIAGLRPSEQTVTYFYQLLSTEEKKRANKYYFDRDKTSFTVARGTLRTLLGNYLDCKPHALQFFYQTHGKPFLLSPKETSISFNVSHSGDLALFAFTQDRKLGVDIEKMRSLSDTMQIAERFFSTSESIELQALPDTQKPIGFFNGWTRKEAFIKATGEGLSRGLDSFDVSLTPNTPAVLYRVGNNSSEASRWFLTELSVKNGYRAALVSEAPKIPITLFRYKETF